MSFSFKSSHLASSISVMTLAVGLAFAQPITQKSLAQTAPTQINGAGADVPNALYTGTGGWFATYGAPSPAVNPNVQLNYASVGSGTGVTAFLTQTPPSGTPTVSRPISFGSTTAPLTTSQLKVTGSPNSGPPIQVPTVAAAIALPYNPSGLNVPPGGLKLSRATYSAIFNGEITNWNDSRITADNGRQVSTGLPIKVVVRSDSSGATLIFTSHLQTASPKWSRGSGTTINWPSTFLKVSGGSGIVNTVTANQGAIGYADNPALSGTPLKAAVLQNKSGSYVAPTSAATSAALSGLTDTDSDPRIITINVPADPSASTAYPVVGLSYLLFYDVYQSAAVADGIKGFIPWAFSTAGDNIARNKGYAPLPEALQTTVNNLVETYVDTTAN